MMTQKLWRHAVTTDGRYEKKEEQEGRNRLQTAWAISTKSNPRLSEQMGKVTTCDNVVMSHPVNFTLPYLMSHSHVNSLVFKKMSCPFILVKVAEEAATSKKSLSCLSHPLCVYAAGAQEKLSVVWQHLQYFPPAALLEWPSQKFIQYERNSSRG